MRITFKYISNILYYFETSSSTTFCTNTLLTRGNFLNEVLQHGNRQSWKRGKSCLKCADFVILLFVACRNVAKRMFEGEKIIADISKIVRDSVVFQSISNIFGR